VVDLFNTIDARLGSLTGLVNNAGILLPQMSVEQMDAERINRFTYYQCYKLFFVL
jgi:NAD(P)-dependent dehydrogenase (short-subunit alcohol dehydrogenase family)